jgi:hypothetical protein
MISPLFPPYIESLFTAEAQRTLRGRREKRKSVGRERSFLFFSLLLFYFYLPLFSLRPLSVLCASAVKRSHPLNP